MEDGIAGWYPFTAQVANPQHSRCHVHQKGHVQDNGIPFELESLVHEFHVVDGTVKLRKVLKDVHTVFPTQASNFRHEPS